MDRNKWNTYAIQGYAQQVGDDPRATGGVQLLQVRQSCDGWLIRTVDSTGKHKSPGPVSPVSTGRGEQLFAQAEYRW